MSDHSQVINSVVVDETGTVIVHDSRPDNLEEDKFWSCTYRAVIKAACAIQERDGVIPESGLKRLSTGLSVIRVRWFAKLPKCHLDSCVQLGSVGWISSVE